MDAGIGPQVLEHLREEPVGFAVIERHVWRRADDDYHPLLVYPESGQHARIGPEVPEVVLLFQPGVLLELVVAHAVAAQSLGRDRVRYEDAPRAAAADVVLQRGPFVVERVDRRNPQRAGGQREVVGSMADRQVEAAVAPEA